MFTNTTRSKRTIMFATGSLLLVTVLAMAIFSTMSGPLHVIGIKSAFAQASGNNATANGNTTTAGNQTSSSNQGGDMAQGDPDGDGL